VAYEKTYDLLQVGDQLDMTWTDALLISVDPPKKKQLVDSEIGMAWNDRSDLERRPSSNGRGRGGRSSFVLSWTAWLITTRYETGPIDGSSSSASFRGFVRFRGGRSSPCRAKYSYGIYLLHVLVMMLASAL
jgi:hypothetical protein